MTYPVIITEATARARRLVGQWPTQLSVGPTSFPGGNAQFTATLLDAQGNPVAGARVLARRFEAQRIEALPARRPSS